MPFRACAHVHRMSFAMIEATTLLADPVRNARCA